MNSAHVIWRGHTKVYHRPTGEDTAKCGTVMFCARWRAQEGTEHQAQRLGLRRCHRCWPKMKASPLTPEDIPCEEGAAVLALRPGVIVEANERGFVIQHDDGTHTRHTHTATRCSVGLSQPL